MLTSTTLLLPVHESSAQQPSPSRPVALPSGVCAGRAWSRLGAWLVSSKALGELHTLMELVEGPRACVLGDVGESGLPRDIALQAQQE